MSGEIDLNIYLRCDKYDDEDNRCTVTFGRDQHIPNDNDGIEMLNRHATAKGWCVAVRDEGLKGASLDALCPDHGGTP